MKRIIINGYFLSRPYTGFGVYTVGLLKALAKQTDQKNLEIIVITPAKPDLKLGEGVTIKIVPEPQRYGARLSKFLWEQIALPKTAKKHRAHLIHHFYPATAVFDRGIKQLVSIHDATPWHFSDHNKSLIVRLFRRFVVWSNRKADRVISVSQFGKFDVSNVFKIPKGKIDVIYNGIDARFRTVVTETGKKRIRQKYNITGPYVFYIGGFEAHKNVRRLVLAFAKAAPQIKQNLVIAGGVFSKARLDAYNDYFDLPRLIKEHAIEDRVNMIGVVPDEDLPALYQSSDLFVMSSLAEGFNLPLVQAFASRVPTIASQSPASQEIAGGAAELVDGLSVESIAAGIVRVLGDPRKQRDLIAKGIDRQNQFHWEDAASRLLAIYNEMAE